MNRKIVLTATVLAATVLFGACVGLRDLGVLDEMVPEDLRANLQVRNNLWVILFNDQPVEWIPTGFGRSRMAISLPPGEHSFMVRWTTTTGGAGHGGGFTNVHTRTVNIEMLPGRTYRIDMQNFIIFERLRVRDVTPRRQR
jgi:hypothetical protein